MIAPTIARNIAIRSSSDPDRAVEERLDREVAAEDDRERHDRRQDPQPDTTIEQDDQQPDAERGPRLAERPAPRPRVGSGSAAWRRWARGSSR
jgi:hypothetical protein